MPHRLVALLSSLLCVLSLAMDLRAEILIVGDPDTPPLDELLAALRVQLPQQEQRIAKAPMAERAAQRVLWARGQLQAATELEVALWVAPEDAPVDGKGPYTVTLVRRLPGGSGIEQIPIEAETGAGAARLAALQIAELVRTAPRAPAVDEQETAQAEPPWTSVALDTPAPWRLSGSKLRAQIGAEARYNPASRFVQAGPAVAVGLDLPWSFGVSLGASWLPPLPRNARDIAATTEEVDVNLRLRWLGGESLALGGELAGGIRWLDVEASAFDGTRGDAGGLIPYFQAHAVACWPLAPFFLLAGAGVDLTPLARAYSGDKVIVYQTAHWSPSARLLLEFRF